MYTHTHIPGEALDTGLMSIQRDIRGVLQHHAPPLPPLPLGLELVHKEAPPRIACSQQAFVHGAPRECKPLGTLMCVASPNER